MPGAQRSGRDDGYASGSVVQQLDAENDRSLWTCLSWPEPGVPEIIAAYQGISVVLKPRGWEVDGKGSAPNECMLLSHFMQALFSRDSFPLVYCPELDYGFIHRLDIPSSGLILGGTSFEGLFWIRWQLNVYWISREYFVTCRGLAPADLGCIDMPIDVRSNRLGNHRSVTSDHGGPAETWVHVIAHNSVLSSTSLLSVVSIRIRTGRKHQIRTHLRSSGHPSVVDGMYGASAVLLKCPIKRHVSVS